MKKDDFYREHPLKILKYSAKNIWLLIFPLIRGLWAMKFDISQVYLWLRGAWFDIVVVILIILFGFAKWWFSKIRFTESAIIHKSGIFIRTKKVIPYENLASVTREYSFYLRVFNAVRIYVDTCAGVFKSHDMKLIFSKNKCNEFMKQVPQQEENGSGDYKYVPSIALIFFFSILFSSSFSGVLYIGAFFFQGGQVAQDALRKSLDQITAEVSKFLIVNIPYAVLTIIIIAFGTWLISFINNLIRYSRFKTRRCRHTIKVENGTITPRYFTICQDKINYYYLKQNLIMKIFRVMSVNVSCPGYGTSQNKNFPVLLPIETKRRIQGKLRDIAQIEFKYKRQYKPDILSSWQYIWLAVYLMIGILPIQLIVPKVAPQLSDAAWFITVMLEIPAVWYFIIRIAAHLTSGVTIDNGKIIIWYSKRYSMYTIIADTSKLVKVDIRQNWFQILISHKCSVGFYFNGEMSERHYVKSLKMKQAQEIKRRLLDKEN